MIDLEITKEMDHDGSWFCQQSERWAKMERHMLHQGLLYEREMPFSCDKRQIGFNTCTCSINFLNHKYVKHGNRKFPYKLVF